MSAGFPRKRVMNHIRILAERRPIYNVIDARQSDPQANVIQALRGMGYTEQADRYTHFSYEMVALTAALRSWLGYDVSEEDLARPYIEVSAAARRQGRIDLIDKPSSRRGPKWTHARQEEPMPRPDGKKIAEQIAIGALRYFMLKFTAQFRDCL